MSEYNLGFSKHLVHSGLTRVFEPGFQPYFLRKLSALRFGWDAAGHRSNGYKTRWTLAPGSFFTDPAWLFGRKTHELNKRRNPLFEEAKSR